MHGQLGLQLGDALLGRLQLRLLHRRQSRLEALVDAVLSAPGVDRLVTDPQGLGHIGDRAPCLHQVEHLAAELRRISTPPHAAPPTAQEPSESSNPTPANRGHTIDALPPPAPRRRPAAPALPRRGRTRSRVPRPRPPGGTPPTPSPPPPRGCAARCWPPASPAI